MNRITSLAIALAAGLSLSVSATANAQCSAKANMYGIADQTGGMILDQDLEGGSVEFTLWLDTENTLFVMSADPIGGFRFDSFSEDEYGAGAFEIDGLVCKVGCFSEGGLHVAVYGPGIAPVAFVVAANGVAAPVSMDVQPTPSLQGVDLDLSASDAAFQGWGYASDKAAFALDGATILLFDSGTESLIGSGQVIEIESQDLESRNAFLSEVEDELITGVTVTSRIVNQLVVTDTAVVYMTGIATTAAIDGEAPVTVFHPLRVGDVDTSIWTWVDVLDSSYAEYAEQWATCTTCTPGGNACRLGCRNAANLCNQICRLNRDVNTKSAYGLFAICIGVSFVGCGPGAIGCGVFCVAGLDIALVLNGQEYEMCTLGCTITQLGCIATCPP